MDGYKRENTESAVSTDEVAIEVAAIVTGTEYPQPAPLIICKMWNEMMKNGFTDVEIERFDKLN